MLQKIIKKTTNQTNIEDRLTILEENVDTVIEKYNSAVSTINNLVLQVPHIFMQLDSELNNNIIKIRAPKEIAISKGILFILPREAIEINEDNQQVTLEIVQADSNKQEYTIKKEMANGSLANLQTGDIAPNRLVMLRTNPYDYSTMILLNSPIHGQLSISSIVANSGEFRSVPEVRPAPNVNPTKIATLKDIEEILIKLQDEYQTKIHVGTQNPSSILGNPNIKSGSIYMQVLTPED